MIKTVIFDIGNVLADFSWEPFFRSFGFSDEIFERLANATVRDPFWNELDRGRLSETELLEGFIARDPGIEKEIRTVFADCNRIVTKREYAIPWVQHLKRHGYQVLYLSNFGSQSRRQCRDALGFIPYMDGGIMSCELQIIKPEPEIYRALIEKYRLDPEECVFVDDLEKNLEAAEKFGMKTVHAVSHEAALAGLKALGVPSYRDHSSGPKRL